MSTWDAVFFVKISKYYAKQTKIVQNLTILFHRTALSGTETFTALSNIMVDMLFFSSQSLDSRGNISDTTEEENYARKMMLNSAKTKVFLCDGEKFNTQSTYKLCNLNEIDCAVFDIPYLDLNTQCKIL